MFECDETLFKNACNKILETLLSLKGLKTTIIELQSFSENYEGKEIVNNVTNDLLKINNQISTLFENMQHTLSIILGNNGIMNQELNLDYLDTALSFLDGTIAGEYGVNQSNPYDLFKKYIEDPNSLSKIEKQKIDLIYKLFKDYGYADFSDNMINLSLKAFSNGGCGNAAISNIIIDQYLKMENGVEEFENKYGFPLYYVDENGNKRYNYEGLFVSLYLNRAEEQVNTTPFKYMLGMNKVDNRDYIPILDDFNSFISNIDKAFG